MQEGPEPPLGTSYKIITVNEVPGHGKVAFAGILTLDGRRVCVDKGIDQLYAIKLDNAEPAPGKAHITLSNPGSVACSGPTFCGLGCDRRRSGHWTQLARVAPCERFPDGGSPLQRLCFVLPNLLLIQKCAESSCSVLTGSEFCA